MQKPTNIKDKNALAYIQYLEERLQEFTGSPYRDSYLSIKKIVDRGNAQLIEASAKEIDFDSQEFKAVSGFLKNQKGYLEQMEFLKSKMSPEEARKIEQENQNRSLGLAEKLALRGKKQ